MVSLFEELGLRPQFVQAVEQLGFETPTPIQTEAIPALLSGRNVLGQAQTGTGKTAAFALPMLQQIKPGKAGIQGLVLAPTRELAIQVAEATSRLAQNTQARVLAIYGGQPYHIQLRQIERGVDIVVGTPGRMLDLINQQLLDLSQVRFLVLDEADEMLEMGFIEDVETIMAQIPGKIQIALFSATLPTAIRRLADRYLSDPHEISINPTHITVAETEQLFCRIREENKLAALSRMLEMDEVKSALIFARTKVRAQELSDELNRRGYPAESLHGDLNQARREMVLNRFRQHTITLLVATDVAARGLDIEDVTHVINYDIPDDSEDYVHRIGRTGRAGRKGIAITFLTPRERSRLAQFEAFTHQKMTEWNVPTREDILARRDLRFVERLNEQINKKNKHQRNLIAQMVESGIDPLDIAAAAMQLARSGESVLPVDQIVKIPAEDRTARRSSRPEFRTPSNDHKNPSKSNRAWAQDSGPAHRAKREQEPGMVRLWMNLGNSNGIRPGDIVGAIAGEVGIPGRAIGEIDIHTDHTFVDVAEKHVRRVLKESGGQYLLRGKPVLLKLAD
jgi:ATP-dependent RNA helicase DeaD